MMDTSKVLLIEEKREWMKAGTVEGPAYGG
jgi:hypothetical protein